MNEVKGIYKKLMKFQSEVDRLKKDQTNPHFKNSYVDINSVLDEVVPKLIDQGLLVLQPTKLIENRNVLITKIIDIEDDSDVMSEMILPDGLDAQKTGSALTYYRRYELISLLCLQAVDDDGKAGSSPVKESKKPTEEMVLEIESLINGDDDFKTQWLNFLGVQRFDKANYGQLEKAIKQIKG